MCATYVEHLPKLWKTVGDEIIFVNRVETCVQVIAYVHAFTQAMAEYSKQLKDSNETKSLDVKGNGWLASFPYPNQTISVRSDNEPEIITENMEQEADENPHRFEFLGSGIDSGFRIAKNSSPDFFSISPSLALLLCAPVHNEDTVGKLGKFPLIFKGVNKLKGVINGEDYPVVGIYTERSDKRQKLNEKIGHLTNEKLANQSHLKEYLKEFEDYHEVNSPVLKLEATSNEIRPPHFYTDIYCPSWEQNALSTRASDKIISEGGEAEKGTDATDEEISSVIDNLKPKPHA